MKKLFILLLVAVLTFNSASQAYAKEGFLNWFNRILGVSDTTVQNAGQADRLEIRQQKQEERSVAKQEKIQTLQTAKEERTAAREEKREATKTEIAERVNTKLAELNEKVTTSMSRLLARMTALLEKLTNRLAKMTEKGRDVSGSDAAIAGAEAAIATAQAAVDEQAAKTYTFELTDETGFRVGASEAKTSLKADLKSVKELVRSARQSVVDALKSAKAIKPVTTEEGDL